MDADTLKILIPAVAAILGALIGGFGAYLVARANVAGQRQIARDNALREHRASQLQSLRELANRRVGVYRDLLYASLGVPAMDRRLLSEQRLARHTERFQQAWNGVYREGDLLGDMAHASVPDACVQRSIKQLLEADVVARGKVMAIVDEWTEPGADPAQHGDWHADIERACGPLSEAIISFGRAADRYIYGPEPVSWWRRALQTVTGQPPAPPGAPA
ncbi:MAG: hypothetical protein JO352_06585 [Chloroflexi bacterium]|nr:hypothetical protein [Chloroflexota bacterium]